MKENALLTNKGHQHHSAHLLFHVEMRAGRQSDGKGHSEAGLAKRAKVSLRQHNVTQEDRLISKGVLQPLPSTSKGLHGQVDTKRHLAQQTRLDRHKQLIDAQDKENLPLIPENDYRSLTSSYDAKIAVLTKIYVSAGKAGKAIVHDMDNISTQRIAT